MARVVVGRVLTGQAKVGANVPHNSTLESSLLSVEKRLGAIGAIPVCREEGDGGLYEKDRDATHTGGVKPK